MPAKIRFTSAYATGLVLAKIGHPQRNEPLQTSREVFKVAEDDQEILTTIFLKPFKNLAAHRFSHHTSLEHHEMHALATAIFQAEDELLEKGCAIAKRLYAKSNHPNIKSGDLCISLIRNVDVDGSPVDGICILKSECVVPFLSITTRDGDLELHTEQGINPERIDKGCLILNHQAQKGYYVLTFDRSGTDSRFWVRDFLGVVPVTDSPFLTNKFTGMAVSFLEEETKSTPVSDERPPWEDCEAARDAVRFFEEKEHFSLQEFEEQVLKTPEKKARFAEHRAKVEEEAGQRLDDTFEISRKDVAKAKRRINALMRLDTGVVIRLKPAVIDDPDKVLEYGFDAGRGMKFVKVFFRKDHARPGEG